MRKEDTTIYETLDKLRNFNPDVLNESEEKPSVSDENATDAVPYTVNDDLLSKMTDEAKKFFGADFSKSKTPLLYYPKDDDVTLSGVIPGLENAVFQFQLNSNADGSGITLWVDSLPLSDSVISTLSKMNGAGKNWKNDLNAMERQDLKPVSVRDDDASFEQIGNETEQSSLQPGDDLD